MPTPTKPQIRPRYLAGTSAIFFPRAAGLQVDFSPYWPDGAGVSSGASPPGVGGGPAPMAADLPLLDRPGLQTSDSRQGPDNGPFGVGRPSPFGGPDALANAGFQPAVDLRQDDDHPFGGQLQSDFRPSDDAGLSDQPGFELAARRSRWDSPYPQANGPRRPIPVDESLAKGEGISPATGNSADALIDWATLSSRNDPIRVKGMFDQVTGHGKYNLEPVLRSDRIDYANPHFAAYKGVNFALARTGRGNNLGDYTIFVKHYLTFDRRGLEDYPDFRDPDGAPYRLYAMHMAFGHRGWQPTYWDGRLRDGRPDWSLQPPEWAPRVDLDSIVKSRVFYGRVPNVTPPVRPYRRPHW